MIEFLTDFRLWLGVIASATIAVVALFSWRASIRRTEISDFNERIAQVEAQMEKAEDASSVRDDMQVKEIRSLHDRVSHVETQLDHMPTKDSVHRLEVTVEGIKGDMRSVSDRLGAVSSSVGRIETFLLAERGR